MLVVAEVSKHDDDDDDDELVEMIDFANKNEDAWQHLEDSCLKHLKTLVTSQAT